MPSLGADMESGVLLEWLVQPGLAVRRGDPMAVVDTDKAAIEVESFVDGVVGELLVEPGERVAVGAPLATLVPEGEPAAAAPAPSVPAAPAQAPPAQAAVKASPPVRHHAEELGVDLATVTGTGRKGAMTRADVDRAARVRAPAAPAVPAAAPAATAGRASPYARRLAGELGVDLSQVAPASAGRMIHAADVLAVGQLSSAQPAARPAPEGAPEAGPEAARATRPGLPHRSSRATIAALMSRAKREIPHYYVATTVDMEPVTTWLRRHNRDVPITERIVPAAALLKATALALREFPELNGFWTGDRFEAADDVHLGVAVTVRGGALVAPAIHRTADLDLPTVMGRLRDLVGRARAGWLTRAEMADPTLTVTDLGDQGVEEVIGVIYPPQVGLLGVGRIVERPWAVDGRLGVNPVVRLTLSGDHRATDGYTGARFLAVIDRLLQKPEEL